jgi:hypothetical protein
MNRSRSSISKAASLRPELEFEVIKLTLLRENYIKRLAAALDGLRKELDIGIVGLVDVLRDTSIQVVETIITWERAQVSYPNTTPYMWNGEEYLHKMLTDMDQFAHNKQLQFWLGFSLLTNPFFVPQEIYVPVSSRVLLLWQLPTRSSCCLCMIPVVVDFCAGKAFICGVRHPTAQACVQHPRPEWSGRYVGCS